ncbi:hypothetical protein M408DRAFT_26928 [Serendipita vermifera MAFF 305830]|uniref:Uncharacterized protein n=1 Tax=Serendipita vermifera MAFF 305830 TaxID=933852 RepID=A0A0C2X5T6_SERVB|nr:hypothetical protein M408DRAFT_26928 [Serendipita vermifera MAFF 305830]
MSAWNVQPSGFLTDIFIREIAEGQHPVSHMLYQPPPTQPPPTQPPPTQPPPTLPNRPSPKDEDGTCALALFDYQATEAKEIARPRPSSTFSTNPFLLWLMSPVAVVRSPWETSPITAPFATMATTTSDSQKQEYSDFRHFVATARESDPKPSIDFPHNPDAKFFISISRYPDLSRNTPSPGPSPNPSEQGKDENEAQKL